jgi:eukaryotic-like serine/threonine-protein kinase
MPPKVIGPYRVLETIGSGGVGTVYRAVDRRTNEPVALKLLSTGPALDPKAARRLAREFETLSELSHPNVVKVFDTGVHQGYPYMAMELVEGLTLRHYLSLKTDQLSTGSGSGASYFRPHPHHADQSTADESIDGDEPSVTPNPFNLSAFSEESPSLSGEYSSGPESVRALADAADEPDTNLSSDYELPYKVETHDPAAAIIRSPDLSLESLNDPERVGRLKDAMIQLCQALAYIHGHGLIHRDLKPSNVMVDEDRLVRLMDFGLAKFLADDSAVTANGRMVGTFRYMSPEQIQSETLDSRADLYSLGIILYELLAGRPPYDAKAPYELWQKVLESDAPSVFVANPRSDIQLGRIAHRLILKDPDDRYQTAEEVMEALAE